jgi:choice-of-anchor A domain-containing protein
MKKLVLLAVAAGALNLAMPAMAATGVAKAIDDMRKLNLVVLGNYSASSDVEGKAWIGGDLNNGTTIAYGNHANGQSAKASSYRTLTVKGNVNGNVNLNNGTGVGGNYGAYISGDVKSGFAINGSGGTIKIGGSVSNSLGLNTNTTLWVKGNVNSGLSTNTGSKVRVGGNLGGALNIGANTTVAVTKNTTGDISMGGTTLDIGGSATGSNNNVTNGVMKVRGNVAGATVASGKSLIVGGSLGNFNASSGSTVSMGSYNGSNKVAVSSGSKVYVGAGIGAAENNGGLLEVNGNIGDMQGYSANSITKVKGSIGGNGNGISNKPSYVYASGSIAGAQNAGQNASNVKQNYTFNSSNPAPTTLGTPATPDAPIVGNLAVPLSKMTANMQALSTTLLNQTSKFATTSITTANGGQRVVLNATSTGANSVAIFNVNQSFFSSYNEISYNFSDPTTIVIVNVLNSNPNALLNHSASYSWNMNPVGGANKNANQQLIWNFADAASVTLNRETWGSILAPYATVSNPGGNVNGSLVAKVFNQGGEVHLGTFNGFDGFLVTSGGGGGGIGSVPEPASWATMLTGFGLIGSMIRRRKRQEFAAKLAA